MASNNRSIALAALLSSMVLIPRAEATLMKAATFDQKVENAASIIVGKTVKKEARWDDAHRWILTYTTIRIERVIKGLPAQQEVTIVTPGGQVGDVRQDTSGVPEFEEGSEHVLFLRNTNRGLTVLYFDQGAYDVDNGTVRPVASDAVTIDTQRGMAVTPEEPRTLDRFERDVRDSERRSIMNRMAVVREQKKPRNVPSLLATLVKNEYLVLLALAGVVVATWQVVRSFGSPR
ncbi:MAG TPA: hypothetical protein VLV78_16920 [Thermoanaerobaculia bacterium]|nr:hypothetical protein [Thermoanaerobaculia bacterium]